MVSSTISYSETIEQAGSNEAWESASNILKTVTAATVADAGKFLNYNGYELPS